MATRGLVLSGGGPVGIAWQAGLLAGLAEAGVDMTSADTIIGTSAGSVVGAQLALGVTAAALVEEQRRPRDPDTAGGRGPSPQIPDELIAAFLGGDEDPVATRRRLGEFALGADTISEEEFLATFGHRLVGADWPAGFVCTVVDVETGDFFAFDAGAGIDLVRAVAASCAVPGIFPPITIDGRRYMDGGVRSLTSADLAVGCDEVLVLSLLARPEDGQATDPITARQEAELSTLTDTGTSVQVVAPDEVAREELGPNLMDFSRRARAAEAGLVQGRAEAQRLRG